MRILLLIASSLALVAQTIPLNDPSKLDPSLVAVLMADYRGMPAVKLVEKAMGTPGEPQAVVKGVSFHNGMIEIDVAGALAAAAGEGARGFIGVSFRVQADGKHFENFYIRPTNGRAADQLRRNHSVQYISYPDWPWERLRKETPGVYEAYSDMVAGEWTHLKIVVEGKDGSLYVGGAAQPSLLVHDLKLGADAKGGVALWIGPGTEGYFRNLKISGDK